MHTDSTSNRDHACVAVTVYDGCWDERIAMIRKAIQEGVPLSQIEQRLDWLDDLTETHAVDCTASELFPAGPKSAANTGALPNEMARDDSPSTRGKSPIEVPERQAAAWRHGADEQVQGFGQEVKDNTGDRVDEIKEQETLAHETIVSV